MKTMNFKLQTVTLLGRMNDINFQAVIAYEPEGPEQDIDAFFLLDVVTKAALTAGVKPPVGKPQEVVKPAWPFEKGVTLTLAQLDFPDVGCPDCGSPLQVKGGINQQQKGRKWVLTRCTRCDFKHFWDDQQIKERWG